MFQMISGMLIGAVKIARIIAKKGANVPKTTKYSAPSWVVKSEGLGNSGRLSIRSRMVEGKSTFLKKLMFSEYDRWNSG